MLFFDLKMITRFNYYQLLYFFVSFYNLELQSCLVCIARRIGFVEKTNSMLGVEQFTTKQDIHGKIIAFDTR